MNHDAGTFGRFSTPAHPSWLRHATLAAPEDVWDRVAAARFSLARGGTHAHLVDLLIALTASHPGHGLLTRDRNFTAITRAVPLDVELF